MRDRFDGLFFLSFNSLCKKSQQPQGYLQAVERATMRPMLQDGF